MKKRILSAIVMLLICIPIIYFGDKAFRIGIAVVSMLALREMIDLKKSHHKIPKLVELISYLALLFIVLAEYEGYSILFGITYKGIAILLLSILSLCLFYKKEEYTATDALVLIGTILLLGTAFNTMILVRNLGLWNFCSLILIFILTDTFALFSGMAFGKHKLIPHVSPNKTWEGSIGGTFIATIGVSIFYHYLVSPVTWKIVLGILILSVMGQIGDLIFSKIKRENNIKDFSNLIPGHGGILDRLDSTITIMLGYLIIYSLF
ncbi:MAG: phosphatidate cytidylyltransferase [Bacilli bacterium]|jgi:phosphatidate cytidylyltransferase|nr:phosphatidate cytidylyltransferase [Bacilli bacterium]